jgi:predicted NACHT family NTPase
VQLRAVAEVPEVADAFTPEEKLLLRLLDEQGGREAELREAQLRLDTLHRERWTHERLERFPIGDALRDPQRHGLVMLGDPGSGKTTLLQFLALVFAHGPARVAEHMPVSGIEADRLPIFAPLATYDEMLKEMPELTVAEFLPHYYDRRRAAPGLELVFDTALRAGRALVLLDGMDEVVDEGRRKFVAEQTSMFIRQTIAQGNRVLLTSRIYGYRAAPLTVERLAVNPLLLIMLALLRRQVGNLPQRRIKLYDLYIGALIQTWEELRSRGARRDRPQRIDPQEAENALIPLALWLQQHRGSGTATYDDLMAQLTNF